MITAALALPASVDAAPECRPAVILVGDAITIQEIAAVLRVPVVDAPRENCPTERADVERVDVAGRPSALRISITDADGRRTERQVSDVATAATVIESFAIVEGTAPAIHAVSRTTRDPEQPPIAITRNIAIAQARGAIGVALESAVATDRSIWFGIAASGCVQLGPTCVGGQARVARDAAIAGDAKQTSSSRTSADLLFTVDVPLNLAVLTITPGAGLGVGWMRGRAGDTQSTGSAEMFDVDAGGLHANLHVGVGVPVRRGISLTLGASFDLAPFAHTAPYMQEGQGLAGEPRAFARLELGLQVVRQ